MPPTRISAVLVMLLASGVGRLAAQTSVVRGHVLRADLPVGLSDADLVLRPSGAMAHSDERGFFEFRGVAPGHATLAVRRLGFGPRTVELLVDTASTMEIDVSLEPAATLLSPIVTSATREERSLSDVPAAVSVADTSVLAHDRTAGLHEALAMMPGVQVASRYGTDDVTIGIRGSASRAQLAVRGVAVLLDGVPLTEPDGAARLDLIELAASQRVEVVRGPASALYAGSSGGLVNVVSRTGRESRGVSADVRAGAFGFRKLDGYAGGLLDARSSGFAAASYTSWTGYRAHSDADMYRGQVAFDLIAASGTRVAIEANGSHLDSRLPGGLNQPEFDADPDAAAPATVPFRAGRADTRYRTGARVEHRVGGGLASGYVFFGGRTLELPVPGLILDLDLHRLQGGMRVRSGPLARAPLEATIGFDYDRLFGTDRRWVNAAGARGAPLDDGYFAVPNLGAYSQVEWRPSGTARVTAGMRYDRVTYRFESHVEGAIPHQEISFDQLSPRFAAVWSPGVATTLYASVARGLEVPAIGELSDGPSSPVVQSLRPKSLWNYEVGARRVIGGRVLLDGALFYADVDGEFVSRTENDLLVFENAGRSRDIGAELGVTAHATRRLQLAATYTFLDLRLKEYSSAVLDQTGTYRQVDFSGKVLPAVPRHRATAEARLRGLGSVDVGVQVEWQGVVYVETGNARAGTWYFRMQPGAPLQQVEFRAVPARTVAHLDAAWQHGPVTLVGRVDNLFGGRYAGNVVANDGFGRFYEAGPPVAVSLGLRLTGWGHAP